MHFSTSALLSLLIAASSVVGHGVITEVKGANGKKGVGFGVTDVTGKKIRLFNQAARYLTGDESSCGSQKLNGKNQTHISRRKGLPAAVKAGLPTADANGIVSMTLFQVNGDGAGPYVCEISTTGEGKKTFKPIKTVKDVPGVKGSSKARNTAFPLEVQIPAGTKCTGPGGACLIRCKNGNRRPFGGCIAVALGNGKANGKNEAKNGTATAVKGAAKNGTVTGIKGGAAKNATEIKKGGAKNATAIAKGGAKNATAVVKGAGKNATAIVKGAAKNATAVTKGAEKGANLAVKTDADISQTIDFGAPAEKAANVKSTAATPAKLVRRSRYSIARAVQEARDLEESEAEVASPEDEVEDAEDVDTDEVVSVPRDFEEEEDFEEDD